ncbi:hypothetical protein [Desulforhabdus sp. TSK]|uniref:hypothetical protein n=1 Tax=Desulforhabdus sp. TSK TaxID=2925014 RepID=UPI001FC8C56D|nr:hypothetical protein [Desulforhabdus sp. TSK]GKT10301.1 hypothetical protein DSTSK_36060 [Desulforhabdus sp. TSK]
MDSLVYNIPLSMVAAYRGRRLIVRAHNPAEVPESLTGEDLQGVACLQVVSSDVDLHPLMRWGAGVPLDLVVQEPERDLPMLYHWSPLLDSHPVRITVPVVSGFSKVAKLAAALNFAVKLHADQPDPARVAEMLSLLHAYLHETTMSQPIEYFQSMFLAFYREDTVTLWSIQEEDPAFIRYLGADGKERLARGEGMAKLGDDPASFVPELKRELESREAMCSRCEFFHHCVGYFQVPHGGYDCKEIKAVFRTLKEAADELRGDLASFPARGREGL